MESKRIVIAALTILKISAVAAVLIAAIIAASSSSPKHSGGQTPVTTFVTHISADGTKLFVFSLQLPQSWGSGSHDRSGGMHGNRNGGMGGGDQNDDPDKMKQSQDGLLQAKLAHGDRN